MMFWPSILKLTPSMQPAELFMSLRIEILVKTWLSANLVWPLAFGPPFLLLTKQVFSLFLQEAQALITFLQFCLVTQTGHLSEAQVLVGLLHGHFLPVAGSVQTYCSTPETIPTSGQTQVGSAGSSTVGQVGQVSSTRLP